MRDLVACQKNKTFVGQAKALSSARLIGAPFAAKKVAEVRTTDGKFEVSQAVEHNFVRWKPVWDREEGWNQSLSSTRKEFSKLHFAHSGTRLRHASSYSKGHS